jgi:hypothetical protein
MREKLKRGGRKASSYDNPMDINKLSRQTIEKVVSSWAKRANEAFRELERKGQQNLSNSYVYFEGVHAANVSYMDTTKKGEMKFNTKVKKQSLNQLRQEARQLQTFIFYAKTYTPTGVKERYRKQYESYKNTVEKRVKENKEKGIDEGIGTVPPMSFEEFSVAYKSSGYKKAQTMWGSEIADYIYSGQDEFGKLKDSEIDEIVERFYSDYLIGKSVPYMSFFFAVEDKIRYNEEAREKAAKGTVYYDSDMMDDMKDDINKL